MTNKPTIKDSLLLCASDLQHSAIYDNHIEMQSCIRAVADRITALVSVIDGVGRAALAAPAQAMPAPGVPSDSASAVREACGKIIKTLAAIVNSPQSDDQFDREVLQRDPVMAKVMEVKSQVDAIYKAVPLPIHPYMQRQKAAAAPVQALDALKKAGAIAVSAAKTNSRDIADWREDMYRIAAIAAKQGGQ